MLLTAALALAALTTAAISAILGMAGGVALVGIMTLLMPSSSVIPIHGAVQLASNFTRTVAFLRHVNWPIFLCFAAPIVLGMALATPLWRGGSLPQLRPIIGGYIIGFLLLRRFAPSLRNPPYWMYGLLGLISGFLGLFVGATGPLIAPFFLRDDFDPQQVIATKAVCQAWTHLFKLPAFLAIGFDYTPHLGVLSIMIACAIAGTFLGKRLLARIPRARFEVIFQLVLGVLAAQLIVSYFV